MTLPGFPAINANRNLDGPYDRVGGIARMSLGCSSGYDCNSSAGDEKNSTCLILSAGKEHEKDD